MRQKVMEPLETGIGAAGPGGSSAGEKATATSLLCVGGLGLCLYYLCWQINRNWDLQL